MYETARWILTCTRMLQCGAENKIVCLNEEFCMSGVITDSNLPTTRWSHFDAAHPVSLLRWLHCYITHFWGVIHSKVSCSPQWSFGKNDQISAIELCNSTCTKSTIGGLRLPLLQPGSSRQAPGHGWWLEQPGRLGNPTYTLLESTDSRSGGTASMGYRQRARSCPLRHLLQFRKLIREKVGVLTRRILVAGSWYNCQ